MVDGPAGAFGKLCYHVVAIAEECDVEVDVVGRFAGDVDLRHLLVDIVWAVLMCWLANLEVEEEKAEGETYISETGATFIDVPMTMIRSTIAASCSVRRSKKRPGSFSPKNVMLG